MIIRLLSRLGRRAYHLASLLKDVRDVSKGDASRFLKRHAKAWLIHIIAKGRL